MDIRKQLYYVLENYLNGNYSTELFCSIYYDLFYPDEPKEYLSIEEFKEFEKLGKVVSRYSQYIEDHKACPKAFSDDKEILQTAKDVLKRLK